MSLGNLQIPLEDLEHRGSQSGNHGIRKAFEKGRRDLKGLKARGSTC